MIYLTLRTVSFALLMVFAAFQTVNAAEQIKLTWDNLIPDMTSLADPLLEMNEDQRMEYENIDYWQSLKKGLEERGVENDYQEIKKAAEDSRLLLVRQGIDVDNLYRRYRKFQNTIKRRSRITVKKYNGKLVSLAGFLLPLDFADDGVKEFLLVPYVGACIHVPPPPANQMAFVRLSRPYKIKDLYDPVWITGRINAEAVRKNLSLVDGSDRITAGYSIAGESIKKYVRPKLPPLPEK